MKIQEGRDFLLIWYGSFHIRYYYAMQWKLLLSHVVNTKGGIGLMGLPGKGEKGNTGEKGILLYVHSGSD